MRFREWNERLSKAAEKVRGLAVNELAESIMVDGNTIQVTLSAGDIKAELNGNETAIRYLRGIYTNNKEEFDVMLENLEEAAERNASVLNDVASAMTEQLVPEQVLNRMAGKDFLGTSEEMLNHLVNLKLKEIWEAAFFGPVLAIEMYIPETNFSLDYRLQAYTQLNWRLDKINISGLAQPCEHVFQKNQKVSLTPSQCFKVIPELNDLLPKIKRLASEIREVVLKED